MIVKKCSNMDEFPPGITSSCVQPGFWEASGIKPGIKLAIKIVGLGVLTAKVEEYNRETDTHTLIYEEDGDVREHDLAQCKGRGIVSWELL
jgi:hypothetical protein